MTKRLINLAQLDLVQYSIQSFKPSFSHIIDIFPQLAWASTLASLCLVLLQSRNFFSEFWLRLGRGKGKNRFWIVGRKNGEEVWLSGGDGLVGEGTKDVSFQNVQPKDKRWLATVRSEEAHWRSSPILCTITTKIRTMKF